MARGLNLFTIPPGAPFLATLVDALVDGVLVPGFVPRADPLALASATLFLPTRRSIRALREVFLDRLGGEAVLLPRLMALGEVDEDEAAFEAGAEALGLPEAVGGLERQIALTRLILAWSKGLAGALLPEEGEAEPLLIPSSSGDAAALAVELGRFIDGMTIERVPAAALEILTAEHQGRYDRYWDLTTRFLEIVTAQWPAHVAEQGRLDAAERRNLLLEAEVERFSAAATGPVVVAGSTGSIPATRDLMRAVAANPRGAVVLPGLDQGLDEASWRAITDGEGAPGHPQAGLKALLAAFGVEREAVAPLGRAPRARAERQRILSEALRPAETTHLWAATPGTDAAEAGAAFADVTLVEAANEAEEALAVALVLRETLEMPGRRAALITPDRALAARVAAELGRWGIEADDSAGRPLLSTPPGVFARLVLDVALSDFAAVPVLALLKHPFAALGLGRGAVRAATQALEIGALRGPQPPPGIVGLRKALALGEARAGDPHAPAARRALSAADWAAAARLLDALDTALSPLRAALREAGAALASTLFAAHVAATEAAGAGTPELYAGEAGEALADFFEELLAVPPAALDCPAAEYPGLFAALAAGRTARGGEPRHPAIAIFGLLEARLIPVDRLVLGGLDEGVWPPDMRTDPWLNRPMRAAIGLPAPEKRIGLTAHDFEQAFGAGEVVLTRALKRGGAPTVAARWLQRLAAARPDVHAAIAAGGGRWRDLAGRIDAPRQALPALGAPEPRPPLALRPASLSVTEIETLVRDPYAVYGRHVLGLEPLEEIATAPDAADRGTLVHAAAAEFAALCAGGVPPDAEARLRAIEERLFADFADYPDVQAFWRPRFARIAAFLAKWERSRRGDLAAVHVEASGRLTWDTAGGRVFTLRARADRIEARRDGGWSIVDFKTGQAPTGPQVQVGLAPQLALEAAMLMQGGFAGLPRAELLAGLAIVRLAGDREGGQEKPIQFKDETAEAVALRSLLRLKGLIDRFEDPATPYASRLHPMFQKRFAGDYDHLARVREWSLAGEAEEAE